MLFNNDKLSYSKVKKTITKLNFLIQLILQLGLHR